MMVNGEEIGIHLFHNILLFSSPPENLKKFCNGRKMSLNPPNCALMVCCEQRHSRTIITGSGQVLEIFIFTLSWKDWHELKLNNNSTAIQQYSTITIQQYSNTAILNNNSNTAMSVECLISAQLPTWCTEQTSQGNNTKHAQTGSTVKFKQRFRSHKESFLDPEVHQTSLSQYI